MSCKSGLRLEAGCNEKVKLFGVRQECCVENFGFLASYLLSQFRNIFLKLNYPNWGDPHTLSSGNNTKLFLENSSWLKSSTCPWSDGPLAGDGGDRNSADLSPVPTPGRSDLNTTVYRFLNFPLRIFIAS